MNPSPDAAEVYREKIAQRERERFALREGGDAIVRLRLTAFAILLAVVWFALIRPRIEPAWLLLPAALFLVLLVLHARNRARLERVDRSSAFWQLALARATHAWAGKGATGARFSSPHHPYADDLDLFGDASLFQRISLARTAVGEETLARWLTEPADAGEVALRQDAVRELSARVDLRETIALAGEEAHAGVESSRLLRWAAAPDVRFSAAERLLTRAVAVLAGAALLGALPAIFAPDSAGGSRLPIWILGGAIALVALVSLRLRARTGRIIAGVEDAGLDLELVASLLAIIERERFASERLARLARSLEVDGEAPSRRIARLRRLLVLLDSRRNQFFLPFAALILWGPQLAFAIERWRRESGRKIETWITAVGELEALSSFAAFAFENPEYAFPDVSPGFSVRRPPFAAAGTENPAAGNGERRTENGPCFRAKRLGHPLIHPDRLVRNDVTLGAEPALLLVSGSNMSGKSTLLRSVGVAAVLAAAGAPVCAASLEISPLRVGASIRIHDSLQEGASRFWAEIKRLQDLGDLARGDRPLLFLLDEILAGTNSHDRRIGAEAVLRRFLERGAIGLVTTHDLALADVAESLAPRARNVHFEDRLEDGVMVFDYRMRDGVVARSNALALMKTLGLVE
ncbi:MAG TPA: DNA mismatch repair protein MutS [Thermoanaerobaculia bacterium]